MNISSREAYSLSLFIVIIGAQLFQRLAFGMLARQRGTFRLSYQYIRVCHLFNLLGRYSNSPTLTRTCFADRGKCYEYAGANCVYQRIHTPPLPQTEDEYEGEFALENILRGKLKV